MSLPSMDATGALLDAHAAKCAALQATLALRERAIRAGVPLLTIGLIDDLTPAQRAALFPVWPESRPGGLATGMHDVWSQP